MAAETEVRDVVDRVDRVRDEERGEDDAEGVTPSQQAGRDADLEGAGVMDEVPGVWEN